MEARAMMELKAREARDLAMEYKVELEGAGKNMQEVSCDRDRLTAENTKLNEELEDCHRAFDKEEPASSPGLFGFFWPKPQKQKFSPSQMIGTLKLTLRQSTQELEQKEAQLKRLEDSCNQTKAQLLETETKLKQATVEFKQQVQAQNNTLQKLQQTCSKLELLKSEVCAVLAHIMPDMGECLAVARELEAYTEMTKRDFTEMQRKSGRELAKFKVQHDEASDSGWRVIECNHESPDMFEELALCVRERFGLANEVLFFQYTDNDGDPISVHNSIELKEAMGHFAPPSYTKLTLHQKKAPNKVMAQAGLPTEKAKDEDVQDELE
jgi:myosin heavy subunit